MEDNLIKFLPFHPQNDNTSGTLQFRKNPVPHKDKKGLSKTDIGQRRKVNENSNGETSMKNNLFLSTQPLGAENRRFLKVGKAEKLNFQRNKEHRKKMETHVFLPLSVKFNGTADIYSSISCENIDNRISKISKKVNTRPSSDEESFQSQKSEQVLTSFQIIPQIIANPLKISDFELGQCIGSGKFGDVHICRHKKTNFIFALKKILKSTIIEYKMMSQFINELKIQYHLDHPNIIKLYAHFDDEYHIFLLMEYAPGGTLMNKIHNTEVFTAQVMKQMLQAIFYTHKHKIIHRDIKPENIVVFFNDTFKLCDFGLAATLDYYNDIRTSFCGTLDYIAPEMKDLGLYSFSVDIWGLGVLCYQVLFGKAPFKDEITKWKKRGSKRFSNWNWQIEYPSFTSQPALTFMSSLLKQNSHQRMSIPSALQSEFIVAKQLKKSILSPSQEALLTLKR